jgi:arginyl-tRNA synthetase
MKKEVIQILRKALREKEVKWDEEKIESVLEVPKDYSNGDFSFPCFLLSKELKYPPHEIAVELGEFIGNPPKGFSEIMNVGPYLNFYLDKSIIASDLIKKIEKEKEDFGKGIIGKGKRIFMESSSPNIAKPFGVGHLRSTIIGNAISNICEFQSFKVKRANYLGDWGTQFGKIINGYIRFGEQKKLNKDPIRHLYEVYVKINKNKKYEEESREWFNKLEKGDKGALDLWKSFRELSLISFNKIYNLLGIKFDLYLSESMYNNEMEKVVVDLKEKRLLRKSEGAMVVHLKKYKLGTSLIMKSDGSTLYATRDLASAIQRKEKYKFDQMIYEVGQEQKLHFKQLFKILELMGYDWAKNCTHISHGLYLGKDGKRLATRKGKTFFMEDIIDETRELAEKELLKRDSKISKKELKEKSLKIAVAAIFYGDLKNNRENNIVFDLERFISFEGNTGPYLLYSYARANSILKKVKKIERLKEISELEDKEKKLIVKLSKFHKVVDRAYNNMNPSLIANYSYELAQIFNEFYHACPVVGDKKENFRLHLVKSFKQVLKNAVLLLGMETLEEM